METWREHGSGVPDVHEEEYTVDELSRLIGIPRDVILHEVETQALKAQRAGQQTICIKREDVLAWMAARGGV